MRIIHMCLAAFYIDGYAYQENVLPRKHKEAGHEVYIIASCETYLNNKSLGYIKPSEYVNEDNIPVIRLPYVRYLPLSVAKKLRLYEKLSYYLNKIQPDFIFLHDIQFLSIGKIVKYRKTNTDVVIVADGHTDYINSARSFFSKYILHRLIYKPSIKHAEPFIKKFYGTLPPRNTFMKEMYSIPENKLEYLPLGVDDEKIKFLDHKKDRDKIVNLYGIDTDDYIIITGGKFDNAKAAVLELIDAVLMTDKCSLIIFGACSDEINELVQKKVCKKIIFVGWKNEQESMHLLSGADLAVYPYLHSTLWEQTAGIGTPLLVKAIENFSHVNINGNCEFINLCNSEEILKGIKKCKKNELQMKKCAEEVKSIFAYSVIARRVLEDNK